MIHYYPLYTEIQAILLSSLRVGSADSLRKTDTRGFAAELAKYCYKISTTYLLSSKLKESLLDLGLLK